MTEDTDALDYRALLDESLTEMEAIAKGAEPHDTYRVELTTTRDATAQAPAAMAGPDVVDLRESFKVSQALFAKMLNVSVSLVRAWERGARVPEGAALRLLEVAKEAPYYFTTRLAPVGEVPRQSGWTRTDFHNLTVSVAAKCPPLLGARADGLTVQNVFEPYSVVPPMTVFIGMNILASGCVFLTNVPQHPLDTQMPDRRRTAAADTRRTRQPSAA